MVKELMGLSFEALSSELRAIGCDARTEEAKERGRGAKSPCPSHLHWALKRIPRGVPGESPQAHRRDGGGGARRTLRDGAPVGVQR
ncbi:MAG: hypothetical protein Q6352_000325 [Candidatus Freyrarchaeum guaymaensis]